MIGREAVAHARQVMALVRLEAAGASLDCLALGSSQAVCQWLAAAAAAAGSGKALRQSRTRRGTRGLAGREGTTEPSPRNRFRPLCDSA